MTKPLFERLLNEAIVKVEAGEDVIDVAYEVVNFTDRVPDVEAFLMEDATLAERLDGEGHNDIVYPDDASESDVVITNLQERLIAYFDEN